MVVPPRELQEYTALTGTDIKDREINAINFTNFQTLKTPETYEVEIWRNDMSIGTFNFNTVK